MNKVAVVVDGSSDVGRCGDGWGSAQSAQTEQIPNQQALAKRYMRAVCPVNRQSMKLHVEWEAAGFRNHDPAVGTPVPQDVRVAFRRSAKASRHAAKAFRKGNWPHSLAKESDRLTEFYVSLTAFYGTRATATVRKSWLDPTSVPHSGKAAIEMRHQLGLPPRGKGCAALG